MITAFMITAPLVVALALADPAKFPARVCLIGSTALAAWLLYRYFLFMAPQ